MKNHLLVALALLLSGCASGPLDQTGTYLPPLHRELLERSTLCCTSFAQMTFAALPSETETDFMLSPQSQVAELPNGRSFFQAFELPANTQSLTVRTRAVNMLINTSGHILVPAVAFLAADRSLLRFDRPDYQPPRAGGRAWGEAVIAVPPGARFVVVADKKSGERMSRRDSDQRSGSLTVGSGPTGIGTLTASAKPTSASDNPQLTGPTATISDFRGRADSTKTELFYVKAIDGKAVRNSLDATKDATLNQGLNLRTRFVDHTVPARPIVLTIVGTHVTAAPIQEIGARLAGSFVTIEGEVSFTPQAGITYYVNGELSPTAGGSFVCIANSTDGKCVSQAVKR